MTTIPKITAALSHVVRQDDGSEIAFAVDVDTGKEIFIAPPIVRKQDITRDDIGDEFICFAKEANGRTALRCHHFIEWVMEDHV